jgi:protein-disulfide isomerase
MQEDLTRKERRKLFEEKKKEEARKSLLFSKLRKAASWGLILILAIFLGAKFWRWLKTPPPDISKQVSEVKAEDWVKGGKEGKIILVEYSDFQCPSCASYQPIIEALLNDFSNDLRFVYRHFPLVAIHKNALPAAIAAEAAGLQGKFWEMHDLLFEKQAEWSQKQDSKSVFVGYAKELGLDERKFISDFESKSLDEKSKSSLKEADSLGLSYTPTFFLDGREIKPRSYEEFKKLIEEELKSKSQ